MGLVVDDTKKPPEPDDGYDLDQATDEIAKRYGVPRAVYTRMRGQESGGGPDSGTSNANAVSPKGAAGEWQMMPATARGLGVDMRDPLSRAEGSLRLLRDNYKEFRPRAQNDKHAWMMAVAGYHGNPANVTKDLDRGGYGLPNISDGSITTRDHVLKIFDGIKNSDLDRTPQEKALKAETYGDQTVEAPKVTASIGGESQASYGTPEERSAFEKLYGKTPNPPEPAKGPIVPPATGIAPPAGQTTSPTAVSSQAPTKLAFDDGSVEADDQNSVPAGSKRVINKDRQAFIATPVPSTDGKQQFAFKPEMPNWVDGTTKPVTPLPDDPIAQKAYQARIDSGLVTDSEELRQKFNRGWEAVKAGKQTRIFTPQEEDLLDQKRNTELNAQNLPAGSQTAQDLRTVAGRAQTQPGATPDAGLPQFTASVDPRTIPEGQDKEEGVFKQAARQLGTEIYGRPLNSLEVDALAQEQKQATGGYTFKRGTKEKTEVTEPDRYTFEAGDVSHAKDFLDRIQPEIGNLQDQAIAKQIESTMELTPDARKQLNEMGITDERIDAAYKDDPKFETSRGQAQINKQFYDDRFGQYVDKGQTPRLASLMAYNDLGAVPDSAVKEFRSQENEAYKRVDKDLRNPSWYQNAFDVGKETLTDILDYANPVTAVADWWKGAPHNFKTVSDPELKARREQAIKDDLKQKEQQFGSMVDFEDFMRQHAGEEYNVGGQTKEFGRNIVRMISTLPKTLAVLDKAQENFQAYIGDKLGYDVPKDYIVSLRSAGNLMSYLVNSATPAFYTGHFQSNYDPSTFEGFDSSVDKGRLYGIGKWLNESVGQDPYLQNTFAGKANQAIASGATFLLGGWVMKGAKYGAGILGAATQIGSTYDDLKQKGADENTALTWGIALGAPLGWSEEWGLGGSAERAMAKLGSELSEESVKTLAKSMWTFAKATAHSAKHEALEEFLQEWGQDIAQDAGYKAILSKNKSDAEKILTFFEEIPKAAGDNLEQAGLAALSGGVLGGGTHAVVEGINTAGSYYANKQEQAQNAALDEFDNKEFPDVVPQDTSAADGGKRQAGVPADVQEVYDRFGKEPAGNATVQGLSMKKAAPVENLQKGESGEEKGTVARERVKPPSGIVLIHDQTKNGNPLIPVTEEDLADKMIEGAIIKATKAKSLERFHGSLSQLGYAFRNSDIGPLNEFVQARIDGTTTQTFGEWRASTSANAASEKGAEITNVGEPEQTGTVSVKAFQDERRRANENQKKAYVDELTGLSNQAASIEARKRYDADDNRLGKSYVIFDSNGAKGVNDEFGHPEGDKFIQSQAAKIQATAEKFGVPPRDVFRIGGDEFLVIADDAKAEDLKNATEEAIGVIKHKGPSGKEFLTSITGNVGKDFKETDLALKGLKDKAKIAQYKQHGLTATDREGNALEKKTRIPRNVAGKIVQIDGKGEGRIAQYKDGKFVVDYKADKEGVYRSRKTFLPYELSIDGTPLTEYKPPREKKGKQQEQVQLSAEDLTAKPTPSAEGLPSTSDIISNIRRTKASSGEGAPIQRYDPGEGETQLVYTPQNEAHRVAPMVVDDKDILTSFDEGYPEILQPRNRKSLASDVQVHEIAQNIIPAKLGDSVNTGDGRPIAVPVDVNGEIKYALITGNGRMQSVRLAQEHYPGSYAKYEEFAKSKDPSAKVQNPRYIALLDNSSIDDGDLRGIAVNSNKSQQSAMSPVEQAKVDSETLDASIMKKFSINDNGDIEAKANKGFITEFFARNVDASDRGNLIDENGVLTQDGVSRIKRAIIAKAFGDTQVGLNVLTKMIESPIDAVKNITTALTRIAPGVADLKAAVEANKAFPELDISEEMATAFNQFADLRKDDKNIETFLQQRDLPGTPGLNGIEKRLIQIFQHYSKADRQLTNVLNNFLDGTIGAGDPNQKNMFGDSTIVPDPTDLLQAAVELYQEEHGVKDDKKLVLTNFDAGERRTRTRSSMEAADKARKRNSKTKSAPAAVESVPAATESSKSEDADGEVQSGAEQEREAEVEKPAHGFSSTQINLSEAEANKVKAIASAKIDHADLYESDGYENGFEDQPHITVKYGIHSNDAAEVAPLIQGKPEITARLGKTIVFDSNPDYDVVVVKVEGKGLHVLNKAIADGTETTDTHPEYIPHLTLAYVEKGKGAKYEGKTWFKGQNFTFDSVAFSDQNEKQTEIPLGTQAQATGGSKAEAKSSQEEPVVSAPVAEAPEAKPAVENDAVAPDFGAKNVLVNQDRAAELKEKIRKKLEEQNRTANVGAPIDPDLLKDATELGVFYIEGGARKFAEFASKMISDLGEKIRPYLKSIYAGAYYHPGLDNAGMDSLADIDKVDVDAIETESGSQNAISDERAKDAPAEEEPAKTEPKVSGKVSSQPLFDMGGLDEEGLFAQGGPRAIPVKSDEEKDNREDLQTLETKEQSEQYRRNIGIFGEVIGTNLTSLGYSEGLKGEAPVATATAKTVLSRRNDIEAKGEPALAFMADVNDAIEAVTDAELRGIPFDDYARQIPIDRDELTGKPREIYDIIAAKGFDDFFHRTLDGLTADTEYNDAQYSSPDLEPNSDARTEDELRSEVSTAGPGANDRGVSEGSGPAEDGGDRSDSDLGVSRPGTTSRGEGGDLAGSETAPAVERHNAGSADDGRSGTARDQGLLFDYEPSSDTRAAAERSERELKDKGGQQKAAESVEVAHGDLANIREMLPFLLPEQQDDVHFAETRFEQGNGVLFTNSTGTGKTYTGLGIAKRAQRAGNDDILIIAPNDKILEDWGRAGQNLLLNINRLSDTTDNGKEGIVSTTFANFRQNPSLIERKWGRVIIDESHYLSQNQEGDETGALSMLRAITLHPRGQQAYGRVQNMALYDHVVELTKDVNRRDRVYRLEPEERRALDRDKQQLESLQKQLKAAMAVSAAEFNDRRAKEDPSKVTFLSATPFAYEKNIEYAEGYLFDYGPGPASPGYNTPDAKGQFFVNHFGYRMRYGKLTKPEASVNTEIMEQEFNTWLQKQGALSGRRLNIDKDYSRQFVLTQSAIGTKIDEGLDFLQETKAANGKNRKYPYLADYIDKRFDYLARRFTLEAINAKSSIPIVKKHLELGRKVVVFHDYNQNKAVHPFQLDEEAIKEPVWIAGYKGPVMIDKQYAAFKAERPDLVNLDLSDLISPLEIFKKEFAGKVGFFNGTVSKAERRSNVAEFNKDDGEIKVFVAQSDAGREGISLHDTTGTSQRVLINLGLPVRPIAAIQTEGRIYRVGNASDAIQLYTTTGTGFERYAFGEKISQRASTAENLAMGEEARALRQSFIDGYNDADSGYEPNEDEGKGGKQADHAMTRSLSDFDRAKTYYFSQQKKTSRNKAQEGKDYFATPEPIGLKMVAFSDPQFAEKALEPSAGHGAIARFLRTDNEKTVVEPSGDLSSRLALVTDGKIVRGDFEDLHTGANKFDTIVMNPPFGVGGKTAIEHLEKAASHVNNQGRIVALIPEGPAADKRLDQFFNSEKSKYLYKVADISLPGVTFERAGTQAKTHIVVLEKQIDPRVGQQISTLNRDYSDINKINDLFDRIEDLKLPERNRGTFEPGFTAAVDARQEVQDAGSRFDKAHFQHTQTRDTLYVAKLRERADDFNELRTIAKRHGGYYSSFSRGEAIAGFLFKSEAERESFMKAAEPDSSMMSLFDEPQEKKSPIFFSQLEKTIDDKMPARTSAEQVRGIVKDTKQEERDWLGLDQWLDEHPNPTKQELLDFVRSNNVQVEEVEKSSDTKFDQYTLPGGENYRELLLKTRPIDVARPRMKAEYLGKNEYQVYFENTDRFVGNQLTASSYQEAVEAAWKRYRRENPEKVGDYKSNHFSEPNILAHIRFDDRDGGKTLHVAEVQSDWHQQGREKGYREGHPDVGNFDSWLKANGHNLTDAEMNAAFHNEDSPLFREWKAAHDANFQDARRVPDAPFKKSWQELAMKRVIRYAAENGYDRVTWDTGETQADRFDLSHEVHKIEFETLPDGGKKVSIDLKEAKFLDTFTVDKDGNGIKGSRIPRIDGKSLDAAVGKDLAKKILNQKEGTIDEAGMKVGGEGMSGFYDKILPSFVNKYTKKWGAKVEESSIDTDQVDVTQNGLGDWIVRNASSEAVGRPFKSEEAAQKRADEINGQAVHSLTITPAMRESVMQGQPMFSIADEQEETDRRNAVKLLKNIDLEDLTPAVTIERQGDRLKINLPAMELIRRAFEQVDINRGVREFGKEETYPSFLGYFTDAPKLKQAVEVLQKAATDLSANGHADQAKSLTDAATAIQDAAKAGQGTAVFYVLDQKLPQELFHQAIYLGSVEKALTKRHAYAAKLDSSPAVRTADKEFFSKQPEYSIENLSKTRGVSQRQAAELRKAIIREETAAWIAEGSHLQLGLDEDTANNYLLDFIESFAQKVFLDNKNLGKTDQDARLEVDLALARFKDIDYAQDAIEAAINPKRSSAGAADGSTGDTGDSGDANQGQAPPGTENGKGPDASGPRLEPGFEPATRRNLPGDASELGVKGEKKFAALPFTERAAGIAADDVIYTVFGDRAAQRQAERLLQENGIDGTIKILKQQESPDVHHAIAGFVIQRMLRDEATRVEDTNPREAVTLRKVSLDLGAMMALRMVRAGRLIRAASVIMKTTEGLLAVAQRIYQDKHGTGETLPNDVVTRIEGLQQRAETDLAQNESLNKQVESLKREIERLKAAMAGKEDFRKSSPGSVANRKRLVTTIKNRHMQEVEAAMQRLRNRALIKTIIPAVEAEDVGMMSVYDEKQLPDDVMADFANVGAMFLMDGLSQPSMMKPIGFDETMISTFGESITPHLEDIHRESLRLRNQWLADLAKEKEVAGIIKQFGDDLSEEEVEAIVQERHDELRRRAIIMQLHNIRAERTGKREEISGIENVIARLTIGKEATDAEKAKGDAARAAAAEMVHKKPSAHEIYRNLEAIGIKGEAARDALRNGADILERARLIYKKEKAAAEQEIRDRIHAGQSDLVDLQKAQAAARTRARESQTEIKKELERVKNGRFGFYASEIGEALNTPRALMASTDVSFLLRQGGWFMLARPRSQGEAFGAMINAFGVRQKALGYDLTMEEMEKNPWFEHAVRAGMDFAGLGKHGEFSITKGEEEFRNNIFKKVANLTEGKAIHNANVFRLVNAVIQKSDETYTAFLDAQRLATYGQTAEYFEKDLGMSFETHPKEFRALAEYINDATGRSSVGNAKIANLLMSLPLFAPRFTVSRFKLLWKSTLGAVLLPPATRNVVIGDAMRFYAVAGGLTTLAWLGGMGAGLDWDDDDFMKIHVGDNHYDLFVGMQQGLRAIARMAAYGFRAATGYPRENVTLKNDKGDTYVSEFYSTFLDPVYGVPVPFLRRKLSPLASLPIDWGVGEDAVGQPFTWKSAIINRLLPLGIADVGKGFYNNGFMGGMAALPGLTGIGYSNYPDRPELPVTSAEKLASKINGMRASNRSETEQSQAIQAQLAQLRAALHQTKGNGDVVAAVKTALTALYEADLISRKTAQNVLRGENESKFDGQIHSMPTDALKMIRQVANEGEKASIDDILDARTEKARKAAAIAKPLDLSITKKPELKPLGTRLQTADVGDAINLYKEYAEKMTSDQRYDFLQKLKAKVTGSFMKRSLTRENYDAAKELLGDQIKFKFAEPVKRVPRTQPLESLQNIR